MEESGQAENARSIAAKLQARGYQAFLVGGCVRDLLLGREPQDFDISTDATPDQVARVFPEGKKIGAHFGVVLVEGVEVATFRSDHGSEDGRHPTRVEFETDARKDVVRRDFTINGMMLDPLASGPPAPLDYVGGEEDLRRGIIRAIGDPARRFEEDHLRMLRAIRFGARLGFQVDRETMSAMQALRSKIHRIAPERIRDELVRILTEGGARRGLELLDEAGLLAELLPEVAAMKGVAQPPEFHPEGDVWTHTLIMLEQMKPGSAAQAMGVLLHDVGKPPTFRMEERIRFDGHVDAGVELARGILARLRFSTADSEQTLALIAHHMRFMDVRRMRESTVKRFLRLPRFEEHLELHRVDCLASHGHLDNYEFMRDRWRDLPAEEIRPRRLVNGNDLIAAGYRPGPQFSRMLEIAEDAQMEGRVTTAQEALALLREQFGPPPGPGQ